MPSGVIFFTLLVLYMIAVAPLLCAGPRFVFVVGPLFVPGLKMFLGWGGSTPFLFDFWHHTPAPCGRGSNLRGCTVFVWDRISAHNTGNALEPARGVTTPEPGCYMRGYHQS